MNRKLTPEQVATLRHLRHEKRFRLKSLSILFKISTAQVHRIANGTNWKRVTGSPAQESTSSPEKVNP